MSARAALMLAMAWCVLGCEEDEQLLGLRTPPGAGSGRGGSTVRSKPGKDAGVLDAALPILEDAGTVTPVQTRGATTGEQILDETSSSTVALATTLDVGQGAPTSTQEVLTGAAVREPDSGVASRATPGAGGVPGVAVTEVNEAGAEQAQGGAPSVPTASGTAGAQAAPPLVVPSGPNADGSWIHQLPEGCDAPSPIEVGGFIQSAVSCRGYSLSATCVGEDEVWDCLARVMPDDVVGERSANSSAPPPYPPGTLWKYHMSGVHTAGEASEITLATLGLGESWAVSVDNCEPSVILDAGDCSYSPGCSYSVTTESGDISLWRQTETGATCSATAPADCNCYGLAAGSGRLFVSGASDACAVASSWCDVRPPAQYGDALGCETADPVEDASGCNVSVACGNPVQLDAGVSVRPVGSYSVFCSLTEEDPSCSCERPDGRSSWSIAAASEQAPCERALAVCTNNVEPEQLGSASCFADSQSADAVQCRASVSCTWPTLLGEKEVQSEVRAGVSCDADGESGDWNCWCGAGGREWTVPRGAGVSAWDACVGVVAQCATWLEEGLAQP